MNKSKLIQVPCGKLHLVERGNGTPLLMIHGIFSSWEVFDQVLERLPNTIRGIAIDLPGCGQSVVSDDFVPSWVAYVASVMAVVDELNLSKFDIMGHSMGGGIAAYIAAKYPDRVNRLALVDAVTFPYAVPFKARLPLIPVIGELIFKFYGQKMFVDYMKNDVFLDAEKVDLAKTLRLYRVFAKNKTTGLHSLRATANPEPVAAVISKINCPTLVLWGEKDQVVPITVGHQLARSMPNMTLKVIKQCGHSPLEEAPVQSCPLIFDFLCEG